jgi:ribonucleotide reductase beta subunit family protein with ferritin-like domain
MTKLREPTNSFTIKYPKLVEFADLQLNEFYWRWKEIQVEKDKHQFLTELTEAEKHAVLTAAKLFVKYESFVGNEFWMNRVMKMFPRPEVERLSATFGMVELAVHSPFYQALNTQLGLDTDEFWESYIEDPILSSRMDYLNSFIVSDDDRLALAVFSMMEGAILFSSFALFKSFNSNGHNLLVNFGAGINQSALDENLHHEAGAYLFNQDLKESKLGKEVKAELFSKIQEAAVRLYEHEDAIIEKFHEKGILRGITKEQFKVFIKSRLNYCLNNFGIDPIFDIAGVDNPVEKWFGDKIKGYVANDFFNTLGREYSSRFTENKFGWKIEEKANE